MIERRENNALLVISFSELVNTVEPILKKRLLNKPYFIHIAGASGAGKTICSQQLVNCLQTIQFKVFPMDTYMIGEELVNQLLEENPSSFGWDDLKNFNLDTIANDINTLKANGVIYMPVFNRRKKRREQNSFIELKVSNTNVVIVEGIHGLSKQLGRGDLNIFIKASLHDRLWRRVIRSQKSGNDDVDKSIINYLSKVEPSFSRFTNNFESDADLIVNNPSDPSFEFRQLSSLDTTDMHSVYIELVPKKINGIKKDQERILIGNSQQGYILQYIIQGKILLSHQITEEALKLLGECYDVIP